MDQGQIIIAKTYLTIIMISNLRKIDKLTKKHNRAHEIKELQAFTVAHGTLKEKLLKRTYVCFITSDLF